MAKTNKIKKTIDPKYINVPNICFSLTKKNDKREKKFAKERIKYGFDQSETWSLFSTISKFIYPRLKLFRDNLHGCPIINDYGNFKNIDTKKAMKKWSKVLDKMLYSFKMVSKYDEFYYKSNDKKRKLIDSKIEEGLNLFSKYFLNLWD